MEKPTGKVISKSDRFAKVRLVGEIRLHIEDETTLLKTKEPHDSVYFLKKENDTWKIYFTDFPFDNLF